MLLVAQCFIHQHLSSWMNGLSHAKVSLLALCGQEQVMILAIHLKYNVSSDYCRFQWGFHTLLDELGSQQVLFQYHAACVECGPFPYRGSPPVLHQAPSSNHPNVSYSSTALGIPEDIHILGPTNGQYSRKPWLLYPEHLPA